MNSIVDQLISASSLETQRTAAAALAAFVKNCEYVSFDGLKKADLSHSMWKRRMSAYANKEDVDREALKLRLRKALNSIKVCVLHMNGCQALERSLVPAAAR